MATAFFRTVILYLLLIAGLRITGKRQIGELEPRARTKSVRFQRNAVKITAP